MKQILFPAILILGHLLTSNVIFGQSTATAAVRAHAENQSRDKFTVSARTPKGANVYGVKPPSLEMLSAIDKGLDDLFASARRNGYRSRLNHTYYSIFIARPDRVKDRNGNYSPGIAINAGDFAGSQYDQGGFIYVAGLVFYLNPDAFLIVDYGKDYKSVSEIVRYEGEHIILYHNDRRLYNQTANHGDGGGHPILK